MANRKSKGAVAFARWRKATGVKIGEVCAAIGDPGGQLYKWASGERSSLPLHLAVAVAEHMGVSLEKIATPSQVRLVEGAARARSGAAA